MPAGKARSDRISGNSGPIARICGRRASDARNSPATTRGGVVNDTWSRRGRQIPSALAPPHCSGRRRSRAGGVEPHDVGLGGQRLAPSDEVDRVVWSVAGALWTAGMLPKRPAW
jgi:hypothetical protein